MVKLIKETIDRKCEGIDFMKNVLFVLTVPAEYPESAKSIMRKCAFGARLIDDKLIERLQVL